MLSTSKEAFELVEDGWIELLIVVTRSSLVSARERTIMLDDVMLFKVLQSEGAARWVGGCSEGCHKQADRYLGGEIDCGGGLDERVLGYCLGF